MSRLVQSAIKEVAKEIANGNTCYIHRFNVEVITIDHSTQDKERLDEQAKRVEYLELKIDNYVKVETLTTTEQLVIMKDFLNELSDRSVRKQLSNALNRKNPIRNFNQVTESDMALNLHWQRYNVEEYRRWVSNIIVDAYNH